MSFTSLDPMGKANLMMDLISQRQRALSSNIANMDTPGYVRRDIDFSQYLGSMNSPLETKLSTQVGPSGILEDRQRHEIDVAEEFAEMQKNALLYSMATRRMSNVINQMKTVINVGKQVGVNIIWIRLKLQVESIKKKISFRLNCNYKINEKKIKKQDSKIYKLPKQKPRQKRKEGTL